MRIKCYLQLLHHTDTALHVAYSVVSLGNLWNIYNIVDHTAES
jgi:hypothetical protein